jgi:4-amino-4-deoxy-L-arabinose transferase-like glycosyltransferase
MSKSAHKSRRPKKYVKPHKQAVAPQVSAKLRSKKHVLVFAIIAILAAIPFCLGKYFEFNSPGAFDSGAYVYSAKHILDGAKIGVEEKPSAQVGTLLVNILGVWLFGFNETGPKLIQTILQAAALVLMFIAMRKLFGTLAAAVGVIIASVYLSAPLIAKVGNVKEQYMIAFMVMGISCFVLYQLGGKWWHAALAGAFVSWGPLFKQTGMSAIAAIGLFVLAQPFLHHSTWKKTGTTILLLLAGAAIGMAPVYLWLASAEAPAGYWPYSFASKPITTVFEGSPAEIEAKPLEIKPDKNATQDKPEKKGLFAELLPDYVRDSWDILKPEQKKQPVLRVLRYYWLLIVPIGLAAGATIARLVKIIMQRMGKLSAESKTNYDRFVLLFAIWWLLDMALVWVSPRSYEQYYLPLNASAAALGGYLIALYWDSAKKAPNKTKWLAVGLVGFWLMIILSWHIFFGIEKSPYSGVQYAARQRGYAQSLREISARRSRNAKAPWEHVGEYIQQHSSPDDKIYVWGWFPGIYVTAQRMCPVPKAFEGTMHIMSAKALSERVDEILTAFEKDPPKFVVDTRKRHFPADRPPYELWPIVPPFLGPKNPGFLPPTRKDVIAAYDKIWTQMLRKNYGDDEAERYEAMAPFRQYVMNNCSIVAPTQFVATNGWPYLYHGVFGEHILFERKNRTETEQQKQPD